MGFELFFEFLSGTMQPDLDGFEAGLENGGDLSVCETLELTQDEDGPMVHGQVHDDIPDA